METLDDVLGRDTDGADKELCAFLDNDGDELVELALGVVIAATVSTPVEERATSSLLGLARATSDLREQQVHTERRILVFQESLELRNLLPQHVRRVSYSTNHAESACVRDSCGQLGAGSHVHAREEHRVVDLEQIGGGGTELL